LVFRQRAYELDVHEDGDQAQARELSDAMSRPLTGRASAPRIVWGPPLYPHGDVLLRLLQVLLYAGATMAAAGIWASRVHGWWIPSAFMIGVFLADLAATERIARENARRRSSAAELGVRSDLR
jgi:hypothetical protein